MKKMKYIVIKDFLDRFNNKKLCKVGEEHVPPNEERAQLLIDKGFIEAVDDGNFAEEVEDGLIKLGGGYYELPNGEKVRGKEKALEALAALNEAGDVDVE